MQMMSFGLVSGLDQTTQESRAYNQEAQRWRLLADGSALMKQEDFASAQGMLK
jgi:hypothetical protein